MATKSIVQSQDMPCLKMDLHISNNVNTLAFNFPLYFRKKMFDLRELGAGTMLRSNMISKELLHLIQMTSQYLAFITSNKSLFSKQNTGSS